MLQEEIDRSLKVTIPEYQVLFDSKKREYVSYTVVCEQEKKKWIVKHRFSEFDKLNKELGTKINAKLPSKFINNQNVSNLKKRLEGLDEYLKSILQDQSILEESCVKDFFFKNPKILCDDFYSGYEDIGNEFVVCLSDYSIEKDENAEYVAYQITCKDSNNEWFVKHRYSEFNKLNKEIDNEEIKLLFPPLIYDNMNVSNIKKRQHGLEVYLNAILKNNDLKSSAVVEEFFNIKRLRVSVYEKKNIEDESESIFTQLTKSISDHYDPSLPNSFEKIVIDNNRRYKINFIPPQFFQTFNSQVEGFIFIYDSENLDSLKEMIENFEAIERKFEDQKFISIVIQFKNGHKATDLEILNFLSVREDILLYKESQIKKAEKEFFKKLTKSFK
eukprot:gene10757-3376_t